MADPDTAVGYGYVMDRLGIHMIDPREQALRHTLFHDILGFEAADLSVRRQR